MSGPAEGPRSERVPPTPALPAWAGSGVFFSPEGASHGHAGGAAWSGFLGHAVATSSALTSAALTRFGGELYWIT